MFALHPDAALEHEEQVAYYEACTTGLGRRYHESFLAAMERVMLGPHRCRLLHASGIRHIALQGFPYRVIFRERGDSIEVLAIAPHRKRPGYWRRRVR